MGCSVTAVSSSGGVGQCGGRNGGRNVGWNTGWDVVWEWKWAWGSQGPVDVQQAIAIGTERKLGGPFGFIAHKVSTAAVGDLSNRQQHPSIECAGMWATM